MTATVSDVTATLEHAADIEAADENERTWLIVAAVLAAATMLFGWRYLGHTGIFDWTKERFYFDALRDSLLTHGRPPVRFEHINPTLRNDWPTLNATNSYVGNPETLLLSPFLPLAALPLEMFWTLYVAASMALAIVGDIKLARALNWTPLTAGVLYGLVFLNPWLIQHLVVGYTPWLTICWLPLAAALIVQQRPVWAGLALSATVWAGGLHVFVWALMAGVIVLCCLAVGQRWDTVRCVGIALGCGVAFAAPRLIVIAAMSGELGERHPQSSYHTPGDLWHVLTNTSVDPYKLPEAYDKFGVVLYDGLFYVGAAFIAILTVAVVAGWRSRVVQACTAGTAFFTVLGWGGVWQRAALIVPGLGAEVYPWRFLPIAYTFAAIAVTVVAEREIRRGRWWIVLLLIPVLWGFYNRTGFFIDQIR